MSDLHVEFDLIAIPPNRQRREFDDEALSDLAVSISEVGLINPITLREDEDGNFTLVAGERRLRAIQRNSFLGRPLRHNGTEVPNGFVPATLVSELDATALYQVELEENVLRVDLSWQDRALAIAGLHRLRTTQATARGEHGPTTADTGEEILGVRNANSQDVVRKNLAVARVLEARGFDALKGSKSLSDAFKALKREESLERHAVLASDYVAGGAAESKVVQGEAVAWCLAYSGPAFDCLLTDPPYGVDADEFGDSGGVLPGAHTYQDSAASFQTLMELWIPSVTRIMKESSHVYQFCDIAHFPYLSQLWAANGWKVFRTPLIWFKPSAYRAPWPEQGPQRKYEALVYAVRGERPCRRLGGDVLQHAPDPNMGHNAQKPVSLYRDLLSRSCAPTDRVLDCFAGSGPIFPAAHAEGVIATGIERETAYVGQCVARLNSIKEEMQSCLPL